MAGEILVTGATGFIGSYLIDAFPKSQKIRCLVRNAGSIKAKKNIKILRGDIQNKEDVYRAVKGVDCIIHLAALIKHRDEKEIFKVNVGGTKNLIDAAKKYKVKKFIFLSTENVLFKRQGPYGESKKKAERIVKTFKNHLILRVSIVIGKGNRLNLAKVIESIKKSSIIPIPGNGKSLMQPIYVKDVVRYIINGIGYDIRGVYIVAGKSKISMNDFINLVCKEINKKVIKIHLPFLMSLFLIGICEKLLKNPPITRSQFYNLNTNRTYNIDRTVKDFKYKPLTIREAIKRTV